MAFPSIDQIVAQYGCWAVFVVVGLESAGLLLPGELTLVAAGVIAGTSGILKIEWVITAAAAGAILGDNFGYWLGQRFGFRLLLRHGWRVGIGEQQLKLGQYLFIKHGGKVVFFGRLVAFLRVVAALLAGINRMPWPNFLLCNVAGGILWASLYGGGAFLLGEKLKEYTGPIGLVSLGLGVVAVTVAGVHIHRHLVALGKAAEQALPGPVQTPRK